jgi:hypothetical protein
VADRIRELRALEKQLRELRETCRTVQDAAHCGILNQLSQEARQPPPAAARTSHVQASHGRRPAQASGRR